MAAGSPKFFVLNDVVAKLEADATLREMVSDRIFPIQAPRDTKGDFIAYQRDGVMNTTSSKMGDYALIRYAFYITVVSDNYDRGLRIAERVYELLDGRHAFGAISYEDLAETVVDQKFFQVLKFSIL